MHKSLKATASIILWTSLAGIPALAVFFIARSWERNSESRARRAPLTLLLWLAIATWIWCFLAILRIAEMPNFDWHACRLAPVVALTRGYELYHGPDSGPIASHIYGPVWALAMLPAALGRSVTSIIYIAGTLTVLWFIVPAGVLIVRGSGRTTAALLAVLCIALWSLLSRSLNYAAFWIHVDAVAIGLTALACASLLRGDDAPIGWRAIVLSSLAAALAIWTKQTLLPIAIIVPTLLWLRQDARAGLLHAAAMLAALLVLAGAFALAFDPRDMWFNMIAVPARHPLRGGAGPALLDAALVALRQLAAPLALLAVSTVLAHRRDAVASIRAWQRRNWHWTLPALLGFLLLPTAILGYAKVGGDYNNFAYPSYFLLAAAMIALARASEGATVARLPRVLLVTLSIILAALALGWPGELYRRVWFVTHFDLNRQEAAYELARRHPGRVYLPWNTLSTLLADGELYHFDWGLYDRRLAGFPPSDEHLRAHVPRHMRIIALPRGTPSAEMRPPGVTPIALDELPGYDVYPVPAEMP